MAKGVCFAVLLADVMWPYLHKVRSILATDLWELKNITWGKFLIPILNEKYIMYPSMNNNQSVKNV